MRNEPEPCTRSLTQGRPFDNKPSLLGENARLLRFCARLRAAAPLQRFVDANRELAGFGIVRRLQALELALQGIDLIRKVQAGENSRARVVDGARLVGDAMHQIVNPQRQLFHVPRLTGSDQRVVLVEDGDANRFRNAVHLRLPVYPGSWSICPSSFSMRLRTCLRSLRSSSSSREVFWKWACASATSRRAASRSPVTASSWRVSESRSSRSLFMCSMARLMRSSRAVNESVCSLSRTGFIT